MQSVPRPSYFPRTAKTEREVHGEVESECPGYCGAQDTFYVGIVELGF